MGLAHCVIFVLELLETTQVPILMLSGNQLAA